MQGRSFYFKLGSFWASYDSGPDLAHDDGMFCGEFRTGSGWTWRKGLAYAGTETRWFVGLH